MAVRSHRLGRQTASQIASCECHRTYISNMVSEIAYRASEQAAEIGNLQTVPAAFCMACVSAAKCVIPGGTVR